MNDVNYEEPQLVPPAQSIYLESIVGMLPQVTAVPTLVPRLLKESLAVDTSAAKVYYYDFTNNVWKTLVSANAVGRFELKIIDDTTALTTGESKLVFMIPAFLNGLNLTVAHAFISTVSSSGLPTIAVRNVTDSVEMLSTSITIDVSEFTSYTAVTPPVIDTAHDDVATGDLLAIDCDVAGTGAKGLGVYLEFS